MLKKLAGCTIALMGFVSSYMVPIQAFAGDTDSMFSGTEIGTEITYDKNGFNTITHVFAPFEFTVEEQTDWEVIPPLTEPPEVGTTLGNILKDVNNPNTFAADSYTEPYATYSIGQCAWYADGRFMEVYGIRMPFGIGDAKDWLNNASLSNEIKTVLDTNDIKEQSIAVYIPDDKNAPGHVRFVEYVERNSEGIPINVYYTDANGVNDLNKGEFNYGYDGTVQIVSFEKFKNPYKSRLAGYIIPAN